MEKTTETARLLTVEEAAQQARVHPDFLRRYARTKKVTWYRKLGHRTTRIEPLGFQAWLEGRRGR